MAFLRGSGQADGGASPNRPSRCTPAHPVGGVICAGRSPSRRACMSQPENMPAAFDAAGRQGVKMPAGGSAGGAAAGPSGQADRDCAGRGGIVQVRRIMEIRHVYRGCKITIFYPPIPTEFDAVFAAFAGKSSFDAIRRQNVGAVSTSKASWQAAAACAAAPFAVYLLSKRGGRRYGQKLAAPPFARLWLGFGLGQSLVLA